MAVIEKRRTKDGKIHYRVKIRLKGQLAQTATHERLTDAKRWAQVTEAAIREGRHFKTTEAKKHTLAEAIDRYLQTVLPRAGRDRVKRQAHLSWWKVRLGKYLLADVTPALIGESRDVLMNETTTRGSLRSGATANRYLSALSHLLSVAVREWGWLEDSPMRKVSKSRESRGRVRFLDENEKERLFRACKESSNEMLFPAVIVSISTGVRLGELLALKWSDVDFGRRRLILHYTKNGEKRGVPLAGQALQVLLDMEKRRRIDSSLIFCQAKNWCGSKGSNVKDGAGLKDKENGVQKVQKPVSLRGAWEVALKKGEIKNFRWHDLRHCCASYLLMSGASTAEIAEILGHKTLAMVKRYSHLADGHAGKVIERMNEQFVG
jgi:integrase